MAAEFEDYFAQLLKDMDNSKTLEELGTNLLLYQMQLQNIDRRYFDGLAARIPWVTGQSATLEESGKLLNLTRERMRQIEAKLKVVPIQLIVAPKLVYSLIGALKTSKHSTDFFSQISQTGLSSSPDRWTMETIQNLVHKFDVPKAVSEFDGLLESIKEIEVSREIADTVRQYRNALGLIDLPDMSAALQLSPDRTCQVIESMYPFVLRANNLIMANQRRGGSITNILLKQLSIKSPLKPSVLAEGVERAANYRRTPMIGSQDDVELLIKMIAGEHPSIENLDGELADEFELGDIEVWLQRVIGERATGLVHRDELTEFAIADGINPSSVGAYLSISTIIRNVSPGIFTLVGNEIDKSVVENYRNHFLSEYVPATLNYEIVDERLMRIVIVPNTALYTGGSLSINIGLYDLISEFRFKTYCHCGNFASEAEIRIAPSGYWIGFTALLMHSRNQHGGEPGKEIVIQFDFLDASATLLKN